MSAKHTVWKFLVPYSKDGFFEIECQADAKVVMFGNATFNSFATPTVWMELKPAQTQRKTHKFRIVGTGMDIPPNYEHVISYRDGPYVWHLYQKN